MESTNFRDNTRTSSFIPVSELASEVQTERDEAQYKMRENSVVDGVAPGTSPSRGRHQGVRPEGNMKQPIASQYTCTLISANGDTPGRLASAVPPGMLVAFAQCYVDVFSAPPYGFSMCLEDTVQSLQSVFADDSCLSILFSPENAPERVQGFGVGHLTQIGDKRLFFLDDLGVSPRLQGRGVGGKLLSFLLQKLPPQLDGVFLTTSESNTNARRFYSKHGFFEIPLAASMAMNLGASSANAGRPSYTLDPKVFLFRSLDAETAERDAHKQGQRVDLVRTLRTSGYLHSATILTADSGLCLGLSHGAQVPLSAQQRELRCSAVSGDNSDKRIWPLNFLASVDAPHSPESVCTLRVPPDLPASSYAALAAEALRAEVELPHRATVQMDVRVESAEPSDQNPRTHHTVCVEVKNDRVQLSPINASSDLAPSVALLNSQKRHHKGAVRVLS